MEQGLIVGLVCFGLMLTMCLVGVPLYLAMLIPAVVGLWVIGGLDFLLTQATRATFNIASSYTFVVIPMFTLMGIVTAESGIAGNLYNALNKWLSNVRGGLLIATIGANALFGACNGAPIANNVIFTKVSWPQLDKHRYDPSLSLACVSASGALASLIPPSMPIVIFCIIVNISIGKALIAGILPGIIASVALVLTVWGVGIFRPKAIPSIEKGVHITWKERINSFKLLLPVVFLFGLVVGGLYLGFFPPTVAGAVGAAGALFYAAIIRSLNMKKLAGYLWETVIINSQVFSMVISGLVFSRMVAICGLATFFNSWFIDSQIPVWGVLGIFTVFVLIMGCFMDILPVFLITLPVIFPILTNFGLDPYALCIYLVLMTALGALTPPVGVGCFIVASIAKVDSKIVFRGIIPFLIVFIVLAFLFVLIPDIVTWLPSILMD